MTSLRDPRVVALQRHLQWLLARTDRKARHRRVITALDRNIPRWEQLLDSDAFQDWLFLTNPLTQKPRITAFTGICERYDERSLVVFLELFRAHIEGRKDLSLGAPLGTEDVRRGDLLFERYEVYDLLGAGGFAEVFLVADIASKDEASLHALKLCRRGALSADYELRFHDEARLLLSLPEHPNLMPAQFLERAGDSVCVLSEVSVPDSRGRVTMADHARTGTVSVEQQLRWAVQCCDGLQCLYDHGIRAHRDIKPANVLIDWGLTARVADFGLASLLPTWASQADVSLLDAVRERAAHPINTRETVGTPAYMAPEQFSEGQDCDFLSDIYSLGISLFEVASGGQLPFMPLNLPDIVKLDRRQVFAALGALHRTAPLPPLNTPLFPVIARCCAKSPDDRFSDIRQLRAALLQLANSLGLPIDTSEATSNAMEFAFRAGNQGVAHARFGEHEQAVAMFRKAHALFELGPSLFNAGLSLMALKRYDEALVAFEADTQGPRPELALHIGLCKSRTQGWQAALPHFEEAARGNPEELVAWEHLLYGYQAVGQLDKAARAASELEQRDPTNPTWTISKAELEIASGRPAHAYASIGKLGTAGLAPGQLERRNKVLLQVQQHAVFSRAKALLGSGYNPARLKVACDVALAATFQTANNREASFVEALRREEPAVLPSKAEELYRQVFGNA